MQHRNWTVNKVAARPIFHSNCLTGRGGIAPETKKGGITVRSLKNKKMNRHFPATETY